MATHKNTQRFNCTACGATDDTDRCLGNSTVHTGGRWMMPADFDRYMSSRRPVDRDAAAELRAKNQAAREAIAALENAYGIAQLQAASAQAQAELRGTEEADDAAEAAFETYRAAADDLDRCLIFGCEATAVDGRVCCPEHNIDDDTEPEACGARIMHDAIGYGCRITGEHTMHESPTGLTWYTGKARPAHCPAEYCAACEADTADLVARNRAHTEAARALDDAAQAWTAAEEAFQATSDDMEALAAADDITRSTWRTYKEAVVLAGKCIKYADGCREGAVDMGRCEAHALAAADATAVRPAPLPRKALTALPARTTYIHRVKNPHTGGVEFPEHRNGPYNWVGYALDHNGRSRVVGYSNDPDEATAIKHIARYVLSGTEVAVVPARPANARERDAYIARRTALAPTDAKRARWAKRLTDAAIDYARTDHDDPESAIAEAHLADLVRRAMRDLGDKWEVDRMHVDWSRRITTRADNAARWFLIAERDLDNHPRTEALDYRITGCLKQRDALIAALEAVTKY